MGEIKNTAVLLLTCNDFEAMEIVVDRLLRTTPKHVPIYILSNCHGLPGAEVCEDMAKMACFANYGRVHWIHPQKQQAAYYGIRDAIRDRISETFIVKFDDDAFPIQEGWLEGLAETYAKQDPEKIAYVSGLVNNNPYGFSRLVQLPELADTYRTKMPHRHVSGMPVPQYNDYRLVEPGEVYPGCNGTIWQFPQLARWIHEETTLQPMRYAAMVAGLGEEKLDPTTRYSINVMYFHRDLWAAVHHGGMDDEEMLNIYCTDNEKEIVIRENIPFAHLYFGSQKRYLKDLLPKVREVYGPMDALAGHELVADWEQFKKNYIMEKLMQ